MIYSIGGFLGALAVVSWYGRWISGRGALPSGWVGLVKVLLRRVVLDGVFVVLLTVASFFLSGWLVDHHHPDHPVWRTYGGAVAYVGLEWVLTIGRFALMGVRALFSNQPLSQVPTETRYLRTKSVWADDNWVASEIDFVTMTASVTQSLAGAEISNVLALRRNPSGRWETKTISSAIGGKPLEIDSDEDWESAHTATFVNGEALGDAEIETAYQRHLRT